MNTIFRTERDTMGDVQIPSDAYYGSQTQRAVENFPISGRSMPAELIHALALVKWAAASANNQLGLLARYLNPAQIQAILDAALEVYEGKFDQEFPVDVYQTGSGTSSNMNMNEVLSNRAMELCGENRFEMKKNIHPNDHINMGQSTNDIFPSAIHVAAACAIRDEFLPVLREATSILNRKAQEWNDILKIGRTHLADATPMTLGQEFSGYARQMELAQERCQEAINQLLELPVGGTAVGSGINTHAEFGKLVCAYLSDHTGIPFREATNHFEANAQRDGLVTCHALLKSVAVTLMNIANNIRWLASGPRCGYHEITLPDLQPGSSIMPGKINPVLCESIIQLAARIMGNDVTLSTCGAAGGQFQLNITMPLMADVIIESITLMSNGLRVFSQRCLDGITPNIQRCEESVEMSLSMVTSLNPFIGYERAAELAKEAFKTGKTIRQLCEEKGELDGATLREALDPTKMVHPFV